MNQQEYTLTKMYTTSSRCQIK